MYSLNTKTPLATLISLWLLSSIWPQTSYADTGSADISNVIIKQIDIASNGQEYTLANPNNLALALAADVHIQIDSGVSGRVKSWSTWLQIHNLTNPNQFDVHYKEYKKSKSYPSGHRPKMVNRTERLSIPQSVYENLFIAQCNILANHLRNQGLSNKQIFSQDRVIPLHFHAKYTADISGVKGTNFIGPEPHEKQVDIVCKKWQENQHSADVGLAAEETVYIVTDSNLTVLPQSTVGGACNVTLSGVIKTLKPNAPVRFKYRHQDGHTGLVKDSQVYEVTTNHSKTVMFSHQFDIKNLKDQDEHGTLQIIGVSPEFHTKKKLYELACSEPSPNGLTTNLGPEVSAYYLIQERAQIGNQSCPVKVRLVGTIKANSARRGKAIFVGDQYLSKTFSFDLADNSQQQFIADRTINWDLNTGTPQGASHFAHGNTGGNALRFKDIRFGFNVSTLPAENNPTTGPSSMLGTAPMEEYTLAATTPQQNVRLQCEMPVQNQQNLSLSINANAPQTPVPKTKIAVLAKQATVNTATAGPTIPPLQSNNKADIVIRAFNIAGRTASKASRTTLNSRDAIRYENGRCLFDLSYSIENTGQVTSTPFKYQLTQDRVLINQHQNIVLTAGEFDSFYRTVGLKTGMNQLQINADVDNKVIESNENNNQLIKRYNVIGRCDGSTKQKGLKMPSTNKPSAPKKLLQEKIMIQRQQ